MAVKQTSVYPRIEVKARIAPHLHKRMVEECGMCGCHINGFIATAIAHEVADRKAKRNKEAAAYIDSIAGQVEAEFNA